MLLSINSQASKPNTAFFWQVDEKRPYKGRCYEYDIETGGKKFQVKVSRRKCKTAQTSFVWVADQSGMGGRCFEVDSETKGDKFSTNASSDKCHKENSNYQFIQIDQLKGECYQVISQANRRKVKTSKCRSDEVSQHWLPKKEGWGGRCYLVDSNNGPASYIEKVSDKDCRPDNVSYELRVDDKFPEGDCYEVDAESGKSAYSLRVKRKYCLDRKTEISYQWQQTELYNGTCLEFQKFPSGSITRKPVTFLKCIDFEIGYEFIKKSPISGFCITYDVESEGQFFKKRERLESCKKIAGKLDFQFITGKDGQQLCFVVDSETEGDKYIEKVEMKNCEDNVVTPKWFSSDETQWKGNCLGIIKNGKNKPKRLRVEKCRPKKVKILWHNFSKFNGDCYEVDALKGPEFYVNILESKKCRPKKREYIFYRKKEEESGVCYLVDSKTKGDLYYKKVGPRKCKERLNSNTGL